MPNSAPPPTTLTRITTGWRASERPPVHPRREDVVVELLNHDRDHTNDRRGHDAACHERHEHGHHASENGPDDGHERCTNVRTITGTTSDAPLTRSASPIAMDSMMPSNAAPRR